MPEHDGTHAEPPTRRVDAAALLGMALGEVEGDHIGPYELVEPLGEGGFGTVWAARQSEPVRREVALKIIKPGMDTREVIARFEAERQALAVMEHPGIAQVFDAGSTSAGRPYFVMERVRGEPIHRFAERAGLRLRERLELFVEVCEAVAHAHQKGVIHRDLKPSNILVTEAGGRAVPKVIDFGIAKATAASGVGSDLLTRDDQVVGTPLYMAPEQIAGGADIDTRADVYALGAVLYELLAGRPMFDPARFGAAGIDEIRRAVREEEPPKPSARAADPATARALRGELDWIALKALEKDRERRYGGADALGADLARHLAGENVVAAPPSAAYRLRKTLARHRAAFAAGGAVALALIVGATVALWQARAAKRALAESQRSEKAATQARADAEETVAFLVDTFDGADAKATLLDLLTVAERRLGDRFADQPSTRVRLLSALAEANAGLSVKVRAERLWREALVLAEGRLPEDQDLHFDLRFALAGALAEHRRAEAKALTRELFAAARDRYGPDDIRSLRCELHLGAIAMLEHGENRTQENAAAAEAALNGAHAHCAAVLGPEAGLTLACLDHLALFRRNEGRAVDALAIYEQLRSARSRPGLERSLSYYEQLYFTADLHRELGGHAEAIALGEEALAGFEALLGARHSRTQNIRQHLAWSLVSAGDREAAEAHFERLLALAEEAPEDVEALASAHSANAHFRENGGDFVGAVALHRDALAILRREFAATDPRVLGKADGLLRAMLIVAGRGDDQFLAEAEALAESTYRDAVAARRGNPSLPRPTPLRLAVVRRYQGDYESSKTLLENALPTAARNPVAHAEVLGEQTFTFAALGDHAAAAGAQARLIDLQPNTDGRELLLFRLGLLRILAGARGDEILSDGLRDLDRAALTLLAPPGTFPADALHGAGATAAAAWAENDRFPETLYAALGRLRRGDVEAALPLLEREAGNPDWRSVAAPSAAFLAVAERAAGRDGRAGQVLAEAVARARAEVTPLAWSDANLDGELLIEIALREARRK